MEIDVDVVSVGARAIAISAGALRNMRNVVYTDSVTGMVREISSKVGRTNMLRRLRIFAHGSPGLVILGTLSTRTLETPQEQLANITNLLTPLGFVQRPGTQEAVFLNGSTVEPLRQKFWRSADRRQAGWAEIHACRVAEEAPGRMFLAELARRWGVRVMGGTGNQIFGGGIENDTWVGSPGGGVRRAG